MKLLTPDEFDAIHDLADDAGLFAPAYRDQLLDGIDPNATGFININNPPRLQLGIDLRWVDTHEQLADGSTPLLIWLKNAARLTKPFKQGPAFRQWADLVSARASGAPQLSLPPSPEPELRVGNKTIPMP